MLTGALVGASLVGAKALGFYGDDGWSFSRGTSEPAEDGDGTPDGDSSVAAIDPATGRTIVDVGGIRWTMREEPERRDAPLEPGIANLLDGDLYVAYAAEFDYELVYVTPYRDGRPTPDQALDAALSDLQVQQLSPPKSDIVIAGLAGRMVMVGTGLTNVLANTWFAAVPVDDRMLVLVVWQPGSLGPAGEQAFLDLVASVAVG